MTLSPPGAKLAPVDIPPPPPDADPREPEASGYMRVSRTPQRARSPLSSRASSPTRAEATGSPPLLAPKPRSASASMATRGGSPTNRLSQTSATAGAGYNAAVAHAALGIGSAHHGPLSAHSNHLGHAQLGAHLSRPSSPSSIHSSSSAIFERDIELPPSSSTLSHKSSRIFHPHGSNLEHTVPAVLDDAVEALTAEPARGLSGLEIEAPASCSGGVARSASTSMSPGVRSRVTSMHAQAPSSASRSPSPETMLPGGSPTSASAPPLSLGALSSQVSSPASSLPPSSFEVVKDESSTQSSPVNPRPAAPLRKQSGPQLPGSWAFSDADADAETAKDSSNTSGNATPVPAAIPSHLTPTKEKRRISFISYNDLLLSVPTTVTSLNEITSGNLSPDHLPGNISPSVSSRSPVTAAASSPVGLTSEQASATGGRGEWSREGLGTGLEQRLEDLILDPKAVA